MVADGLIPPAQIPPRDLTPREARLLRHMQAWTRREMAFAVAGVGLAHRKEFNP